MRSRDQKKGGVRAGTPVPSPIIPRMITRTPQGFCEDRDVQKACSWSEVADEPG